MVNQHIISVDAGNGGTNAVTPRGKSVKSDYFPSWRARATGDSLGVGAKLERSYTYYDWYDHRYVVGDDVTDVARSVGEQHQGLSRYGDEFHQFLTAVAISRLLPAKQLNDAEIDLTVFTPPKIYQHSRRNVAKAFGDNPVALRVNNRKKSLKWSYSSVSVWPEGLASALIFALDEKGQPREDNDVLAGDVLVLDGGMFTMDAVFIQGGKFNPEALDAATDDTLGIRDNVFVPLLREIKRLGFDFDGWTPATVDRWLRETKDHSLVSGNTYVDGRDVRDMVDAIYARYAETVANNVLSSQYRDLRGIRSLILVGGHAHMVADHYKRLYNGSATEIVNPKTHTAAKIDPVFANVVGGLRLALARQKASK